MTIPDILDFPDIPATSGEWMLQAHTGSITSPWSRASTDYTLSSGVWVASYTWDSLNEVEAREIEGFLADCAGRVGRFMLPLWGYRGARGSIAGVVTATGSIAAEQVQLSGCEGPNPVLRRGDRIEIGKRLYMVRRDCYRDGVGAATVMLRPGLRATVAAEPVIYAAPRCRAKLADDDQGRIIEEEGGWFSTQIGFIEPLP